MESYTVREATRRDTAAICALWSEMMDFHRVYDPRFRFAAGTPRELERHIVATLRSPSARVFAAEWQGQVVGYLLAEVHTRKPIYPVGTYGFISDISVAQEHRRQGVGRALVRAAEQWFRRRRVTAIELFVAEANPVSGAFWRAMGFGEYLRLLRRDLEDQDR